MYTQKVTIFSYYIHKLFMTLTGFALLAKRCTKHLFLLPRSQECGILRTMTKIRPSHWMSCSTRGRRSPKKVAGHSCAIEWGGHMGMSPVAVNPQKTLKDYSRVVIIRTNGTLGFDPYPYLLSWLLTIVPIIHNSIRDSQGLFCFFPFAHGSKPCYLLQRGTSKYVKKYVPKNCSLGTLYFLIILSQLPVGFAISPKSATLFAPLSRPAI